MTIENRVRELRAVKRITQGDLAEKVGVTRQTIVALEKGSYSPSLLLALQIAKVFDTTVEAVFYLEEE
ncbi:helix-turn-helix transcriptional regulator [Shouchella patagoniensis]|uniref:helix-turn-helix transcriptional regulator n=1 Tax=Shouchella patagoniensis TaxID=228576 RepID=UPI000995BB53|nr:helix-turn-helix transcriptional regulator [Shouchella patagoniensis]